MTPPAPRPRDLAGTLICHAAGLTCDAAAAELIAAHRTWLARADFITGHIHAGTRHDGHPYAWIDWESSEVHRPRRPPAQLHRLQGRHPAHRRQPRPPGPSPSTSPACWAPSTTPTSPWSPRPSPARTADRDNLAATTTTRAPQGPAEPAAGPFPSPDMPSQSAAFVPIQNDAGHCFRAATAPPYPRPRAIQGGLPGDQGQRAHASRSLTSALTAAESDPQGQVPAPGCKTGSDPTDLPGVTDSPPPSNPTRRPARTSQPAPQTG